MGAALMAVWSSYSPVAEGISVLYSTWEGNGRGATLMAVWSSYSPTAEGIAVLYSTWEGNEWGLP